MGFLSLIAIVALVYFPVAYLADKLGGDTLQTIAVVFMILLVLSFVTGIPLAFFLFLRYGLV